MISRSISCSWCGHMNSLDRPDVRHCAECGHRADLPRSECDCPKCRPTPNELALQKLLDLYSAKYLVAVQSGDEATQKRIWEDAEGDKELAAVLRQIDEELKREGWL